MCHSASMSQLHWWLGCWLQAHCSHVFFALNMPDYCCEPRDNIETNGLTHWGWVTHICLSKLTIIGSDNGLSPGRRQAIIWTNAGILLIGPLGINFNEILIEIHMISLKKIHLKMSSGKWRPSCLGLNVLKTSSSLRDVICLIQCNILFN